MKRAEAARRPAFILSGFVEGEGEDGERERLGGRAVGAGIATKESVRAGESSRGYSYKGEKMEMLELELKVSRPRRGKAARSRSQAEAEAEAQADQWQLGSIGALAAGREGVLFWESTREMFDRGRPL